MVENYNFRATVHSRTQSIGQKSLVLRSLLGS
jgi:hypothetical protein